MTNDSILVAFDPQLALLAAKADSLLAKPSHVLIDPDSATDLRGRHLPLALLNTLEQLRNHGRVIVIPARPAWNTSDLGPGISRQQLREVAEDIAEARRAIAT